MYKSHYLHNTLFLQYLLIFMLQQFKVKRRYVKIPTSPHPKFHTSLQNR